MRFLGKKAMVLAIAVLTVFLLANAAARGKYQFAFTEKIVTTILAPVDYLFSKIGYGVRQVAMSGSQLVTAYRDNQALRQENEELRQNMLNVNEITAENARLHVLLDYKSATPQFDLITAAVIGRDPASWTDIILINRGSADGVAKDMPIVTPQGLVGNVVEVYSRVAKVQLILDPRSAVGSLVQRQESRVAGIVEGSGSSPTAPRMVNIARDADIIKGDKIVTSGFGGIYPKGLAVGDVVDVVNEEGGLLKYAVLKPAVDFDRLEEVQVILHSREPVPVLPAAPKPAQKGAVR